MVFGSVLDMFFLFVGLAAEHAVEFAVEFAVELAVELAAELAIDSLG